MTAKKRWFLKDSEEFLNKTGGKGDLDISWSSSSSERDFPTKKFKRNRKTEGEFSIVNGWIKISSVPRKKKLLDKATKEFVLEENKADDFSHLPCVAAHAGCVRPSASSSHTFKESPIIGSLKLGEVSPVLGKRVCDFKTSPVIGKRRILPAAVKKKNQEVKRVVNDELETELLHVCPAQNSQTSSPDRSQIINKSRINRKVRRKTPNLMQALECKSESTAVFWTQHSNAIENNSSTSSQVIADSSDIQVDKDAEQYQSRLVYTLSAQQSDTIIDSNSPTCSQTTNITILTDRSCHSPLNYTIDPFISQECPEYVSTIETVVTQSSEPCEVVTVNSDEVLSTKSLESIINTDSTKTSNEAVLITESTGTSSSKSSSVEPLYHEVLPKKRKRYKKDGLADQLQKALHKQKTDFAIWRHELYLQKTKGYQASSLFNENLFILLTINKFWKEFGVMVMECDYMKNQADETNGENTGAHQKQFGDKGMKMGYDDVDSCQDEDMRKVHADSKKCLVIVGFNITHSVRIKINAKLKLCMPYKTKIVKYNGEFLFCYFNVSKLLSFK